MACKGEAVGDLMCLTAQNIAPRSLQDSCRKGNRKNL